MTAADGLPGQPGTPEETARSVIGTAVWAPSVHNTQPWRFAVRRREISLYAGPDRRLAVVDPVGREMLISCGAALFNIRLALRYLGWVPDTMVMPDPGRPMLVAPIGDRHERPRHLPALAVPRRAAQPLRPGPELAVRAHVLGRDHAVPGRHPGDRRPVDRPSGLLPGGHRRLLG